MDVHRLVAQLVEWRSPKPQVGGSIPSWPANKLKNMKYLNKLDTKNCFILFGMFCITIIVFFCNYLVIKLEPIKIILWIVWFVLFCVAGYFTAYGKFVCEFFDESKIELKKVVWPSQQETMRTTMIVIVMVALTGLVLWAVDSLMIWMIAKIAHLS